MKAELLETSKPVANMTDDSDWQKLAIHLMDTKNVTLTVTFIPLSEKETKPSSIPSHKTIEEWIIDDEGNTEGSLQITTNHNYIQVYAKGKSIIVNNANSPVSIYNINGTKIRHTNVQKHSEFYMLNVGLYIVKVGEYSKTVMIR